MSLAPTELRDALNGVLTFPLTPFDGSGDVNTRVFRQHLDLLLAHEIGGIFVGCGTGEFSALTPREQRALVETAVIHVDGRVPVLVGIGNGLGNAVDAVRDLETLGVDGFLVFPPSSGPTHPDGAPEFFRQVASETVLGLVLYQRDGFVLTPTMLAELAHTPNIVGIKDGYGHVDVLQRLQRAVPNDRFVFLNGTPTAELFAPSVGPLGISTYSSAMMNFLPEYAMRFQAAFRGGDAAGMRGVLDDVILPFVEIRDRAPGYAVSLVKAAARLRGLPVGGVRPPLADPSDSDLAELKTLLGALPVPSWDQPVPASSPPLSGMPWN